MPIPRPARVVEARPWRDPFRLAGVVATERKPLLSDPDSPQHDTDVAFSSDDIQAVIASAKARETGGLLGFIQHRHPENTDAQTQEEADRTMALIEGVPGLMEAVSAAARGRDMDSLVEPVLDHAGRYFTAPIDAIPEMTHGLVGLIDDAYFVLRTLQHMEQGTRAWLGLDVDGPLEFLRELLGPAMTEQLDKASDRALATISETVTKLWDAVARPA